MASAQLPDALDELIRRLGALPGIGRRSAERIAFGLLEDPANRAAPLAEALARLGEEVGVCPVCGFYTDRGRCSLCEDPSRDRARLCVVEDAQDVLAFERAGGFRGVYHVLGGVLSPLKGVAPEDLRIPGLLRRVQEESFDEAILALSPSVEGDATAIYIANSIEGRVGAVTRIGRGVSMGSALEMTDPATLRLALDGRRAMEP